MQAGVVRCGCHVKQTGCFGFLAGAFMCWLLRSCLSGQTELFRELWRLHDSACSLASLLSATYLSSIQN